jgi:hypothetical protein
LTDGIQDGYPGVYQGRDNGVMYWGDYYGDKNLLAIGGATQIQEGNTASTIDFVPEKKLPNGGPFPSESEFADYNRLGGYEANYARSQGEYGLGSYLFPKTIAIGTRYSGKFEILGKYAHAEFTHGTGVNYDQKTTEINFNYVMKQFKARVTTFYEDQRFNRVQADTWHAGVGLQIQM